jgi:glyoxylase-like metal-dependent hydrolase (beta-lactamase superfamily II)
MPTDTYRFRIGEIEAVVIADDSEIMLPERFNRAFGRETDAAIRAAFSQLSAPIFSFNCLYLHTPTHHILIDTGEGYHPPKPHGHLLDGMKQAGIMPEQIDTLVMTHLHIDHFGGMVDDEGALIYPNARLVITRREWEHAMREDFLATQDEYTANMLRRALEPYAQAGKLDLLEDGDQIAPGIHLVAMPGHTPGHAGVSIMSGNSRLLHIGDAAHVPLQMQSVGSSPRADADPEIAAVTRRAVFERAAKEGLKILVFHFPFPGLGTVTQDGDVFHWHAIEDDH